jgi:hypothetical protein
MVSSSWLNMLHDLNRSNYTANYQTMRTCAIGTMSARETTTIEGRVSNDIENKKNEMSLKKPNHDKQTTTEPAAHRRPLASLTSHGPRPLAAWQEHSMRR